MTISSSLKFFSRKKKDLMLSHWYPIVYLQVKNGLAIGADLDGLGEKWTGWTALHAAADNQQVHVVKWLLEQGADKNKITLDYSGYTALHLAVSKTNYEIVKLLLDAGADTEQYTASDGYTPLHIASAMGNNCNMILIQHFLSNNFAII